VQHPEWERGPQCLNLQSWQQQAGDVYAKFNHINPASWWGDVSVKPIVLTTSWYEGCHCAEDKLNEVGWEAPFDQMVGGGGHDMLCLFGNGKMVLIDSLMDGERDENEEETDIQIVEPTVEGKATTILHADPDLLFEPDAEDLTADELSHQDSTADTYRAYLVVDTDMGRNTNQHKLSILRIFSNNDPNSTDHLWHVMDLSRFDPAGHGLAIGQMFDPHEPKVSIQDPAVTLIHLKNLICLAFVQIVNLCFNNAGIQSIPTWILGEPNVRVRVQLMSVAPVCQGCKSEEGDWEWTGHFEKIPGSTSTCEIEGHRLQPLDPAIVSPTCLGNNS
jgi:hypothetical protein